MIYKNMNVILSIKFGHPNQFPSMSYPPLYLHPPDLFDNYMQQDAHEFLNYLLNTVADILQEEKKQEKQNGRLKNNGTAVTTETDTENKTEPTWVHDIFQGTLTNETRCLNCETVRGCILPFEYFLLGLYSICSA